jgi:multiple antibiotic resistance protein
VSWFDAELFTEVLITLSVIMDPLGNVPIFLSLTARRSHRAQARAAWQSVLLAGVVIGVFAVAGQQILTYLGITIPALQCSGGLLLLLVALELLRGEEGLGASGADDVNIALVPLGTPLIAGPGAIAATIVFSKRAHDGAGDLAIAAGVLAVLLIIYLALRFSIVIQRVVREGTIHVLSRINGLLLAAIAVQLVADGVRGFVRTG